MFSQRFYVLRYVELGKVQIVVIWGETFKVNKLEISYDKTERNQVITLQLSTQPEDSLSRPSDMVKCLVFMPKYLFIINNDKLYRLESNTNLLEQCG